MADAARPRKSKTKAQKKGKETAYQGPVVFADAINMSEVAAILVDKLNRFLVASPEMAFNHATPDDVDIIKFGQELEIMLDPEHIHELMGSELAQGIMLGMYLMKSQYDEATRLEELENSENTGTYGD